MFKRIENIRQRRISLRLILFVICVVMVFTAQTYRVNEKEQHNQGRPQVQARRETPKPVVHSQSTRQIRSQPPQQQVRSQVAHQERVGPRVYAVVPLAPVGNNNFFHHRHHKNWQPRYNFYDNQYHFYPYVNVTSSVELSAGCVTVLFNGGTYYYDRGSFYVGANTGDMAVPPPIGIIVPAIPVHARQINVDGQIYYRYKGVFYIQVAQGYQVVNPVPFPPEDS